VVGFCGRSSENHLIWAIVVPGPETSIVGHATALSTIIIMRGGRRLAIATESREEI
jgi:hypothetical protein